MGFSATPAGLPATLSPPRPHQDKLKSKESADLVTRNDALTDPVQPFDGLNIMQIGTRAELEALATLAIENGEDNRAELLTQALIRDSDIWTDPLTNKKYFLGRPDEQIRGGYDPAQTWVKVIQSVAVVADTSAAIMSLIVEIGGKKTEGANDNQTIVGFIVAFNLLSAVLAIPQIFFHKNVKTFAYVGLAIAAIASVGAAASQSAVTHYDRTDDGDVDDTEARFEAKLSGAILSIIAGVFDNAVAIYGSK